MGVYNPKWLAYNGTSHEDGWSKGTPISSYFIHIPKYKWIYPINSNTNHQLEVPSLQWGPILGFSGFIKYILFCTKTKKSCIPFIHSLSQSISSFKKWVKYAREPVKFPCESVRSIKIPAMLHLTILGEVLTAWPPCARTIVFTFGTGGIAAWCVAFVVRMPLRGPGLGVDLRMVRPPGSGFQLQKHGDWHGLIEKWGLTWIDSWWISWFRYLASLFW